MVVIVVVVVVVVVVVLISLKIEVSNDPKNLQLLESSGGLILVAHDSLLNYEYIYSNHTHMIPPIATIMCSSSYLFLSMKMN